MRCCRLVITIGGLLLAGAAMNVVVALGIAAFGPKPPVAVLYSYMQSYPPLPGGTLIKLGDQEGDGRTPPWHFEPEAKGVSTLPTGVGHWQAWGHGGVTYAFGWPRPTLRCSVPAGGGVAQALPIPRLPNSLGLFEKTDGAVPMGPLPAGILRNSPLYAAILAVPLCLFPLRRHARTRRGQCAACCYDLAGIQVSRCPECGTPNHTPRAAPAGCP